MLRKSFLILTILSVINNICMAALYGRLKQVSGGEHHTLALMEDKSLWATGGNREGQAGLGSDVNNVYSLQRVLGENGIGFMENVTAFDAGLGHSLIVDSNGYVLAVGYDNVGQLGNGPGWTNSDVPLKVHGVNDVNFLKNIVAVSAGRSGKHSLSVDSNGYTFGWGWNSSGQCGDETTINKDTPVLVHDDDPNTTDKYLGDIAFIIAVDAGETHSIALDSNGHVWHWGSGSSTGTYPEKVKASASFGGQELSNIVQISSCAHSVAVDSNGNVWEWTSSNGAYKVLGGDMGTTYLENIAEVGAGGYSYPPGYSMARTSNGQVLTWTTGSSSRPVYVEDGEMETQSGLLEGIITIGAGYLHKLAISDGGYGWGWGENADRYHYGDGKLGTGGAVNRDYPARMVYPKVSDSVYLTETYKIEGSEPNCARPFIGQGVEDNYLVFEISYGNPITGPNNPNYFGTIYDVNIISHLPLEVDFYSATAGAEYDANNHTVVLNVGTLLPGSEGYFEIVTKVTPHAFPLMELYNYSELSAYQYYSVAEVNVPVCNWGGEIIYVDKDANGFNNGTSWDDAFPSLQDGLADAQRLGDNITAIWVAAGSYKPVESVNVPQYQQKSFALLNNVAIIGHFGGIGTYEDSPDARNLADINNTTILEGKIGTSISEAVRYIVKSTGITNALVDGFTIRNSLGTDGAGIYLEDADVSIVNCLFENNYKHGIYAELYSWPDIHNCVFFNNNNYGLRIENSCQPVISYSVFDGNNVQGRCGILMSYNCATTVTDCIFKNNENSGISGSNNGNLSVENSQFENGRYGFSISDITTNITDSNIENLTVRGISCTLSNITLGNVSIRSGAADALYSDRSELTISDSDFRNNTGYGINATNSDITISKSIIANNYDSGFYAANGCNLEMSGIVVRWNGGYGLELNASTTTNIKNSWIHNNGTRHIPSQGGAGIYFAGPVQTPMIRNNTIYDNWTYGIQANQYGPDPNVRNCIIYGNDSNDFYREAGGSEFSKINYCCLQTEMSGAGNFVADPMFTNGTDPNNLHIDDDSPCVNAGDPCGIYPDETDIDGEPRNDGRVDIGGDENYWSKADYDESGIVDFYDFATFAGVWQGASEIVSLDDDNDVDGADLALFCRDWLWQQQTEGWMMGMDSGGGYGLESLSTEVLTKADDEAVSLAVAGTATGSNLMLSTAAESLAKRPQRLAAKSQKFYDITPSTTISARQRELESLKAANKIDIKDVLSWLDELWLNDKEIRDTISEKDWQEFLESVKSSQ